jgi:hypothetical protein
MGTVPDYQFERRALSISFYGPQPAAEIYGYALLELKVISAPGTFGHDSRSEHSFFRYSSAQAALTGIPDFRFEWMLAEHSDHFGDLGQVRVVTSRTIRSLGKLLGPPNQEGAIG